MSKNMSDSKKRLIVIIAVVLTALIAIAGIVYIVLKDPAEVPSMSIGTGTPDPTPDTNDTPPADTTPDTPSEQPPSGEGPLIPTKNH